MEHFNAVVWSKTPGVYLTTSGRTFTTGQRVKVRSSFGTTKEVLFLSPATINGQPECFFAHDPKVVPNGDWDGFQSARLDMVVEG